MTQFSDFGLADPIMKALDRAGYTTPTPIQAQAIPHLMQGRDLLGIAQTGTGKTAAFALPLIHRLTTDRKRPAPHSCRTLVLAPTRELASQIAESFVTYSGDLQLNVQVVFGGVPIGRQERALFRGVDVLVATPGRLLDLIDRGSCRLDMVEALVLDEADQMLDLGFIHALKRIAKLVPAKRHTLFFSATMPKTIATLADGYLTDPIKVAVAPVAATADRVTQHVMHCETRLKQALLEHLLADPKFDRVIVFTRTKHGADRVVKNLDRAGIVSAAIHGNKSQPQRERALAAFRDGQIGVLVATDIAARGIDIDGVSHVVNFELPNVPESYVHRIGRTARAGADGSAVSFCNREEQAYLKAIERLTRRTIPQIAVPKSIHTRADEIAKISKESNDDIIRDREPRHHAGRPNDGRRGGEKHGYGEKNQPRAQGPRGNRGPREEFRARDEAPAPAPSAAAKPMRDTRHGERVGGRPVRDETAPRNHAPRGEDPRFDRGSEAPRSRAVQGGPARGEGGPGRGPRGPGGPGRGRGPRRDG
ncbi:DEAD/DEAH box helicase [Pinisolibacter aquiterrae]|uniref:DEAD/DEAH box helicase n=1 Tax=Pinisolibacter aquiterrae TaxID=2815579 RepID=UPI001C3C8AE2|nr:DEAD/DEAH box helicase [Pinisolibacter aquiterrae]MBV5266054.1 DEAD/DEAH box helicase [Pinisolibacter aquiterrae]MCC8233653.1 DEAD/DEAH box helicase [Pinisolibacter aquiterrae]